MSDSITDQINNALAHVVKVAHEFLVDIWASKERTEAQKWIDAQVEKSDNVRAAIIRECMKSYDDFSANPSYANPSASGYDYWKRATEKFSPGKDQVIDLVELIKGKYKEAGVAEPKKYVIDDEKAWSAVAVSAIYERAGVYDTFDLDAGGTGLPSEVLPGHRFPIRPHASHSVYIRDAIVNRLNRDYSRPFWFYRLDEIQPSLGDIVVRHRTKDGNPLPPLEILEVLSLAPGGKGVTLTTATVDLGVSRRIRWLNHEKNQFNSHTDILFWTGNTDDLVIESAIGDDAQLQAIADKLPDPNAYEPEPPNEDKRVNQPNDFDYVYTAGGNTKDISGAADTIGLKRYPRRVVKKEPPHPDEGKLYNQVWDPRYINKTGVGGFKKHKKGPGYNLSKKNEPEDQWHAQPYAYGIIHILTKEDYATWLAEYLIFVVRNNLLNSKEIKTNKAITINEEDLMNGLTTNTFVELFCKPPSDKKTTDHTKAGKDRTVDVLNKIQVSISRGNSLRHLEDPVTKKKRLTGKTQQSFEIFFALEGVEKDMELVKNGKIDIELWEKISKQLELPVSPLTLPTSP